MDRGILSFSPILGVFSDSHQFFKNFNTLSANPTKWSNTLQEFVGNLPTYISSVFDHFVGLALKDLTEILSQDNQQILFTRDKIDTKMAMVVSKGSFLLASNMMRIYK